MKYSRCFVMLFVLFTLSANAQVPNDLFQKYTEHDDILILDEEMDISIIGQKVAFMNVEVRNKTVYVIKNEKGLTELQDIELPKRFDELIIHHAPSVRNVAWSYENIRIKKFVASRMVKGKNIPLDVKTIVKQKQVLNDKGFFGSINTYHQQIQDIEVGDTLTVEYFYWFDFVDNWMKLLSNRMFFHGKYPKKHLTLSWSYNVHMEVDSSFENVTPPDVQLDGNMIRYSWEMNNLPGLRDEVNGRPYKELPHFVFVPKPYDFEYTHFDSFIKEFVPIYFYLANRTQVKLLMELRDNEIGNKDKDNLYFQRVADKMYNGAPDDSTGLERMHLFQQYMVDSVRYRPNELYYNHEAQHMKQRPGVELYGYSIADNNIEQVYGNMIYKLARDVFTGYPIDKRSGEISRIYCPTINSDDLMFLTIFQNGSGSYVIPRSDKNHYYLDEMPFYYEGIPVLLLHVYDYSNPRLIFPEDYDFTTDYYAIDPGRTGRNFNTEFRSMITPASNSKENYRKVQSKVAIDSKSGAAAFETRIILSGQYSTLTRCVYCDKPVDSTINPMYFEPIWKASEGTVLDDLKPAKRETTFPFKTQIVSQSNANDIAQNRDGLITMNPGEWMKLVITDANEDKPRFLDYYTDFVGSDQYSYMLEFSTPVELLDFHEDISISNEYASLVYSVKQISEKKILVACKYSIRAEKVPSEKYNLVLDIHNAIRELPANELVVKVIESN